MRCIATTRYSQGEPLRVADCAEKARVLAFLRKFKPEAVAAGHFKDAKTGQPVTDTEWRAYKSGEWGWSDRDIYHFEKYDLELAPEFIAYALGA